MNWFKKQVNKYLDKNEDNERYDDQYEDEQDFSQQEQSDYMAPQKQRTFRFPIIEDKEVAASTQSKQKEAFNQMDDTYYGQQEDLSLPKHLNNHIVDSSVYDVEISGIRELLENRSKRTGRTTITRSQSIKEPRTREQKVFRDTQSFPKKQEATKKQEFPKKQDSITKQERPVENSSPPNRKRFVPTDVPSPVYGFAKPSPIETLLEKRKEGQEEVTSILIHGKETTSNEGIENIIEEKGQITMQEQLVNSMQENEKIPVITEEVNKSVLTFDQLEFEDMLEPDGPPDEQITVPKTTSFAVDFENQVKAAIQQELTVEQLSADQADIRVNEVIVEQVQIENSTFHIGGVTVMQPITSETGLQGDVEEQSIEYTPKRERSRIPFNVLMLKSDKEKWKNRQQSKLEEPSVNEEVKQIITSPLIPVETAERKEIIIEDPEPVNVSMPSIEVQLTQPKATTNYEKEAVSVITMAPVATLERPTIEMVVEDEIAATTMIVEEKLNTTAQELNVIANEPTLDIEEPPKEINEKLVQQEVVLTDEIPVIEAKVIEEPVKPLRVYHKPADEFLEPPEEETQDTEWMEAQGQTLVESLSHFQVSAQIESIMQGPAVTQFEITVSHGTKVSKIRNLADDLKLALAAKDIRIQAPIPGKSSIGIEIPNRVSRAVRLSEVTNSNSFIESDSPLEAALGLDLTGKPVTIDLRKMPHGLIAGATGSGKSVCINSILVSLLYKAAPHELKLMLIDPKMVELAPFNHIPHLVSPVITDVKAATAALKWAVEEMERRYQLFAHAGARDITRYNAIADKNNEHSLKLPYILIVIDELADLMMMSPADVEEAICRIAQKARACGIHLIVATQRPSVDVITGLIKSNIPTRIAFAVSSQIDSRTILDGQGAERLLGRGDMLYLGNGMSAPVRLQGTFVTDDEIEAIIDHVRGQGEPDYIFDQEELLKKTEVSAEQDDLFEDVCRFIFEQGGASTSLIQRKYHIGFNRAARLIEMLESNGFVSEARGSKPRESYITEQDLIAMFE
ncbi:cell division protein [Lysinibacillus contaminans]|uniref:Cell division protein n=1 Tax=Lysinibacillus contaminans TaxID=1293441 RepID=A0ABR5JYP6_9BACI|nr:DNA translocase FtsK [Lysinibacillus contaminans]KOS67606.1 cell division protein [Lysinibacillus contaminans]